MATYPDLAQDVRARLQALAAEALRARYQLEIAPDALNVQETSRDHDGDFTLTVFPLSRYKLGAPDAIGAAIGEAVQAAAPELIQSWAVVNKGFLNFTLTPAFWLDFLQQAKAAQDEDWLRLRVGDGQTIMVEFPSPNTNKPLHLGHLRNIFLGESVCRIHEAAGYRVVRACLYNDKGIHICKSMLAYERFGNGETPETAGLKGDHLVGKYYVEYDKALRAEVAELVAGGMDEEKAKKEAPIAKAVADLYRSWEAGEPAVVEAWRQMNGWFYEGINKTFDRLGIAFDKVYYESETYDLGKELIAEGLSRGVFRKHDDGSVRIDLTDEGLDEKVVLRADGTSIYITQDIGVAELKYKDYGVDKSVYVIGNEQDYHMKVLIAIMRRLGKPYAEGMYHLSYGMVDLPTGKMKSREGTVVDADDMLDEMEQTAAQLTAELGKTEGMTDAQLAELYVTLGYGALRYFLLRVDPSKRMLFNPVESVDFKGHTGPFIQYAHARMSSVLRRAAAEGHAAAIPAGYVPGPEEHDLLRRLYDWRRTLADAARTYNPSLIAAWLFETAQAYGRFWNEAPILSADADARAFRLALTDACRRALAQGLGLLGIAAPEQM